MLVCLRAKLRERPHHPVLLVIVYSFSYKVVLAWWSLCGWVRVSGHVCTLGCKKLCDSESMIVCACSVHV